MASRDNRSGQGHVTLERGEVNRRGRLSLKVTQGRQVKDNAMFTSVNFLAIPQLNVLRKLFLICFTVMHIWLSRLIESMCIPPL